MWKYKHNIQTEIEDTPGGSTISMSALGNTSHTTQTKNPKHCEILIEGILFKGTISQLYLEQISKCIFTYKANF